MAMQSVSMPVWATSWAAQSAACFATFLAILACVLSYTDRWYTIQAANEELATVVMLLLLPVACSFYFYPAVQQKGLAKKFQAEDKEDDENTTVEDQAEDEAVVSEVVASPLRSALPRMATASLDGTVRLWASGDGEFQRALDEQPDQPAAFNAVVFSADGTMVATAACDGTARIWDAETGACKHIFDDGGGVVCSIAVSPCGGFLLTGLDDNSAHIWRIPSEQGAAAPACPEYSLHGHTGAVTSVAFSPCGELAATGSWDASVRLWSVATGACERVLEGHGAEVCSVAFSPCGDLLATASRDGTTGVWSVNAGWRLMSLECEGTAVRSTIFSPCGSRLATGSWDGSVRLWDVDSGDCQMTFPKTSGDGPVLSMAYSADGATIATVDGNVAKLWNVRSGVCFRKLEGHTDIVQSVAFHP